MSRYLKQSTASQTRTIGPFLNDTDFKTAETGLTIANTDVRLKKNGADDVAKNSGGATHDVNGCYHLTFDATDTDTVGELFYTVKVAGALQVFGSFTVLEEAIYDALFAASANAFTGAAGSTTLTALATGSITAAVIANGAIDAATFAADVDAEILSYIVDDATRIDASALNTASTAVGSNGSGLTEAGGTGDHLTALPWNGAWDAEVAAAADIALMNRNLDKLVIASGTADSGSTTTMVDAARTEGDNDYWKGRIILFTSGTIAGQCAIITDFVAATDTFTFSPALTQAVGTQNYVILPNVSVWEDILAEHLTAGTTGNALNAAGSAGDPWSTALPGAYGAGTAGKILGDRLFKLGNEAHAGTSATLTLERIIVAATTSNQPAMKLTGNGTGPGLQVKGGSTGIGAWFDAGDTSGVGLLATGHGVNGFGAWLDGEASNALVCTSHGAAADAVQFVGEGSGSGLFIAGGATGAGLSISGGGTSGVGVQINTVSGDGIDIASAGGVDIDAVLANSATLIGAPVGASISADIAGVATAAVDGVLDGIRLSKNTAFNNFMFKMVLSSDHVSNGTGLTVTAERSLDGAAFAACANAVSEVGSGWYKINLAATDLNADTVALKFTAATADQRDILIVTQPKD